MTNRIVIGDVGSGVYGIKISKPTYNVLSTDTGNLLIDSTTGGFGRVLSRGTLIFTVGGSSTMTASIPSVGSAAPWVEFRRLQISSGKNYAFYPVDGMQGGPSAGWDCSASDGTISVTAHHTRTITYYIGYFVMAHQGN